MLTKRQAPAVPARRVMDPFALLRQMASEFDRTFDWPSLSWPAFRSTAMPEAAWCPKVEVFQKDNRFVTRVDLPGVKKEDVSLEVVDGYLKISGERKYEFEEERDDYYRSEREYGKFFRTIPLPEDVKAEDIRAVFADGVLEVSAPMPLRAEAKPRKVAIEQPEPARPEMTAV